MAGLGKPAEQVLEKEQGGTAQASSCIDKEGSLFTRRAGLIGVSFSGVGMGGLWED